MYVYLWKNMSMKKANLNFKHALRFINRHEDFPRAESLAKKPHSNFPTDFWKEIKRMNEKKMSLP